MVGKDNELPLALSRRALPWLPKGPSAEQIFEGSFCSDVPLGSRRLLPKQPAAPEPVKRFLLREPRDGRCFADF